MLIDNEDELKKKKEEARQLRNSFGMVTDNDKKIYGNDNFSFSDSTSSISNKHDSEDFSTTQNNSYSQRLEEAKKIRNSFGMTTTKDSGNDDFMNFSKDDDTITTIHQKDDNNILELVLPNNDVVMINPCIINQNLLDKISGECHNFSRFMLNHDIYKNNNDVIICTGIIKSLFGHKMYHTIIVDQGNAMDFVNNIQMPLEDYINIFEFDIINMQDKISFFATVNMLNHDDIEFRDSNLNEPLKCTLNKQMNKNAKK